MYELRRITKSFGGIVALDNVSLTVAAGECHALVGENGAGKSTLGRILAGIHRPEEGEISIGGKSAAFRSPADALHAGVAMVHQELAFCPDLSIAENLCMGRYPRRGPFLRTRAMHERAQAMLAALGGDLDIRRPIRFLSTAQEQLVQIAAAVGTGARLLILDEPTSSLSESEAQRLFTLLESLRGGGTTLVYVSHRLPEVLRLADRITVLRDGKIINTTDRAESNEAQLIQHMIGRPLEASTPRHLSLQPGAVRLEAVGLSSPPRFKNASLSVRAHEIVGIAGLVGSGRSELAQALFGLDRDVRGSVKINGRTAAPANVAASMRAGLGLVPEDRKRQGLVLGMGGRANASLATLDRLSRGGLLDRRTEARDVARFFDRLAVRTPTMDTPVQQLSGGNQQKVVLAKWLLRDASVLIVDEPTRGVDVGAKASIHELLDELACRGLAILLISSDLPELIRLSTRILVMRAGRIVAEVPRSAAPQETLLRRMADVPAAPHDQR